MPGRVWFILRGHGCAPPRTPSAVYQHSFLPCWKSEMKEVMTTHRFYYPPHSVQYCLQLFVSVDLFGDESSWLK